MPSTVDDAPGRPRRSRPFQGTIARYAFGVAVVLVAFLLRTLVEAIAGSGAPFVLFFGAVVAASVWGGFGPGLCATLLSFLLGTYEFVVRADFTVGQAVTQASLFAADGLVVVYLSTLLTRARRAAEISEARSRDLIELAPDAFFLADLEGRFTDVNQSACRMHGYQRQELIGKTIADVVAPEELPRLEKVREMLLVPGQVQRGEFTHLHKDGRRIPVEVSANILPGGRWQAFARDISERKRIGDERQVFVSLLDNASDFIGITDPTGKPVYLNPAGRDMVGIPADYPINDTQIPEYYPAEERAFATDVILKTVLERGRWTGETTFRHWQTERAIPVSFDFFRIYDPKGERVLGMGTVTRDISESRRIAGEREELLAREQWARLQIERAHAELRESEERFRLTIDEAPIGMALVSLDGRFDRVNAALCEIVGYTPEELKRLKFQDLTHPEDLDSDLALLGPLVQGEIPRYQLEKRYVRKDGSIVPIMMSASVLRSPEGAPLYCIVQLEDIGERKRSEHALQFSEARFSGIISISADAIISIDENQKIVLYNDGAERIFGYSRAEALGTSLDLLIPERLRAAHRQHIASFAAGPPGSRKMGEGRMASISGRRSNGEEFPAEAAISKLEVDGRVVLTVALRDITERKRIEEDQRFLAEAGAVLAASLDYEQTLTTVGRLMVRDFADVCVLEIIKQADRPSRLRAVSAHPNLASHCAQLEHLWLDPDRPHLTGTVFDTRRPLMLERVTPQELESFGANEEHLRLLRAIDPRSLIAVPLLVHGQLQGVMVLISNTPSRTYKPADLRLAEALAERAALALENGRLYQTALRATRLRDEVLGIVAHDLRNPVASIMMMTTGIKRAEGDADQRSEKARAGILRAANRMNRLIGDLLDVTLVEAGQLAVQCERLSTRQLVMDSIEVQRPLASSASIEVHLQLPDDLPDIWGDQHRVLQVIDNLVGNGIKFTPVEGRITVGAAPRDGEVLFWVADTGAGISPDSLPHVFDRFWQARKGTGLGAGLGLPISRGIVEAHGGRIWVESKLGRGTIFFFTIPRWDAAEDRRSQPTVH